MSVRSFPAGKNFFVKPDPKEEETKGGIVIPSKSQKKTTQGTVIAVGAGEYHPVLGVRLPVEVKEGDRVTYKPYEAILVEVAGEEIGILTMGDVLVIQRHEEGAE